MFTQGKRFNFFLSKMKHWVDEQKVNSLTSLPLIIFSGYCCQATPTQDIWFGYLWAPGGLLYLLKELNKVNGSRLYPSFNLKSSYPVKCSLPSPAATRASSKLWPFFSFLNKMLLFPRRHTLMNFHLSYCLLLTHRWLGCCSLLNCTQRRVPQRKDYSTSQSLMRCL